MAIAPSSNLNSADTLCLRLLISGRVQGVGYRYSTREQASALGLVGWVRNLPDGRVEAMVEGDRPQVEEMVQWFHSGPPMAQVEAVKSEDLPLQKFRTFEIRR
ncbi:acylphosphatase [Leptolyngbya sp. BC1307]|uniref:acylphosphatase n=1 Tax=Leptolyngbya sp. BC1307 TaxID=2029589 RepID=UPI001F0A8D62|nr:acylphosphatase [Leptolyngbya sp. BC1307]